MMCKHALVLLQAKTHFVMQNQSILCKEKLTLSFLCWLAKQKPIFSASTQFNNDEKICFCFAAMLCSLMGKIKRTYISYVVE